MFPSPAPQASHLPVSPQWLPQFSKHGPAPSSCSFWQASSAIHAYVWWALERKGEWSSAPRQSFHGCFFGKVGSSASALSCSSELSPRYLPHAAILSFPFPKKNKFRGLSMNYWTVYPTFHKLICNLFHYVIQQRINLRQSCLTFHLPPEWTCFLFPPLLLSQSCPLRIGTRPDLFLKTQTKNPRLILLGVSFFLFSLGFLKKFIFLHVYLHFPVRLIFLMTMEALAGVPHWTLNSACLSLQMFPLENGSTICLLLGPEPRSLPRLLVILPPLPGHQDFRVGPPSHLPCSSVPSFHPLCHQFRAAGSPALDGSLPSLSCLLVPTATVSCFYSLQKLYCVNKHVWSIAKIFVYIISICVL